MPSPPCSCYITGPFDLSFIPSAQQSLLFGRWSMNTEHIPLPTANLSGEQSLGMHLNAVNFSSLEAQEVGSEVRWSSTIQFSLCRDVRVYSPHPLEPKKRLLCSRPPGSILLREDLWPHKVLTGHRSLGSTGQHSEFLCQGRGSQSSQGPGLY